MRSHHRAMSLSRLGGQSYRIGTVAHTRGDHAQANQTGHRVRPRAWADSSCYSKVIPALRAEGHLVPSSQQSTVHPKLQRFVANRTGATTYEVRSNRVSMFSQPSPAS